MADSILPGGPTAADPVPDPFPAPDSAPPDPTIPAEPTPALAPEPAPVPTPAPADPGEIKRPHEKSGLPEGYTNARDYGERGLGITGASQFTDDFAFMNHMAAQAAKANEYQRELQAMRDSEQWQQLQKQQQEPAATPAEDDPLKSVWNPPPYDPSWERLVQKDSVGNLSVPPGHDPSIPMKYAQYHEYRRNFAERFFSNPGEVLEPFIEKAATAKAQRLVEEQVGNLSREQHSQTFIKDNSDWLHTHDPNGKIVYGNDQKPMLSAAGHRFLDHLQRARDIGLKNHVDQADYAKSMVQRDMLVEQMKSMQVTQTNDAQRQQLLETGNRRPNHSGSLLGSEGGAAPVPQNADLSLSEQMMAGMKAAGITDDAIANELL